ncbi:MAG: trimethylamine methyltransferase family protein [Thermoleophilia bacterium]
MSDLRPIVPVLPRLTLTVLTSADVERLHLASLTYLQEVGVRMPSKVVRTLLLAAGAEAGEGYGRVKLPAALVESALAAAPRSFALGGRRPEHDLPLDGEHVWLAAGGLAGKARAADGTVRYATAADLVAACTVTDYLSEIAFVTGPPLYTLGGSALGDLAACLQATSKHVQLASLATSAEAEAAVAMATAVAGSALAVRQRPPLSLIAVGKGFDAALVFAAAGLPVGGLAAPASAAAPTDVAAALVLVNAAVLAGCVAVQTATPGAPFLYVANPGLLGWRLETAQANLFAVAARQLAQRYGLPMQSGLFTTGSPQSDWQASTQNSFAGLTAALAHCDLLSGAGLLAGGDLFSGEQLVMDSELFSVAAKIGAAITVDDETIALETIAKVGIGGNYLGERHTRRHMKDVWRPRLLDRSPWDAWVAGGKQDSYDKAAELVRGILDSHQAVPLDGAVAAELQRIISVHAD